MLAIIIDQNKCTNHSFLNQFRYYCFTIDQNKIYLDDGYHFNNNLKTIDCSYQEYVIYSDVCAKCIFLYLYQDEDGLNDFKMFKMQPFILSSNPKSTIVNYNPYLKDKYLIFRDKTIETNSQFVFLNNRKYKGQKLDVGDKIEFLGFVFYIGNSFLYINNFNVEKRIQEITLKEDIVVHENRKPFIHNFYEEECKPLVFENIKHFIDDNKANQRKLLFQLGPALTMALGMCMLAAVNIRSSYTNSTDSSKLMSLLIMPIMMIVSSFVWPLISGVVEKNRNTRDFLEKKNAYLKYLESYKKRLDENIENYIRINNHYSFQEKEIEKRWFYINKNSKEFLKITLGVKDENKESNISFTHDEEINQKLNEIKKKFNIDKVPIFLDLKECNKSTFISNYNVYYLFNRVLLELVSKYSYRDFSIAIFSKDKNVFKEIYQIPHLIYKNRRLCFVNEKNLLLLNKLSSERDIVLLALDDININLNENIKIIFFSSNNKNILKESNAVVEYKEEGIWNNQIHFQYEFNVIDFNKYFDILSLFLFDKNKTDDLYLSNLLKSTNILSNYQKKQHSLEANFAISNNEILNFDLHESKDGPHGLIGGSTGSGKTEAIVSLLLSLAIKYRSDYLNFILIDYKGGGIKESLSSNGTAIPHIVASISNLENDSFERLMVCIDKECKRRLLLFKALSKDANQTIMNLDDYLDKQEQYHYEKLAHILVVVDEFAELKTRQPEIIKKLISFSRIGRSLGLHLILATQKPSGVIDEEIWSNSHFKIALKMHSEKDSYDVIKSNNAAYLCNPGEFILKEENSEIHAKAIYAKMPINNYKTYEVALLDNSLNRIKNRNKSEGENVPYITFCIEKIIDVNKRLNIITNKLCFEKPKQKTVNELRYQYQNDKDLIWGEIDDYQNAKSVLLSTSFFDNVLVYTNDEKTMNTILNQYNAFKIPTVIIGSKRFVGGNIKDFILYEEEEDIHFLFQSLLGNKDKLTIIIEDLNTFLSYSEDYLNNLYILIKRSKIQNFNLIIFSKNSNINLKLLNCFKIKFVINAYDSQDLMNIYGMKSNYIGRSYFFDETPICFVECINEDFKFFPLIEQPYLKHIPSYTHYEENLLGYDVHKRDKVFLTGEKLIICGFDRVLLSKYKERFKNNKNVGVFLYNQSFINMNVNILWVGDGVYNQRIFYISSNNIVDSTHVYYYRKGVMSILKGVDFE